VGEKAPPPFADSVFLPLAVKAKASVGIFFGKPTQKKPRQP